MTRGPRRHRTVSRRHRTRRGAPKLITLLLWSLLIHLALLGLGVPLWPFLMKEPPTRDSRPMSLVLLDPPEPVEPPPPPLPDRGQIVELPPPLEEERPDDADYLAEHQRKVEKETRTDFKVNPEVLAPEYSKESKLEFQDLVDLNVTEPSTGAKAGNDRFDPSRDGNLAISDSPFSVTNKEGLQKPVPSSHSDQALSGAPSNDHLTVERGAAVNLNTNEFLFAGYINRIRRLVNFYWQQNLDNLPNGQMLGRTRYETTVDVVLTADGVIQSISIKDSSGAPSIDSCVVAAFHTAGPFPHPPSQLVGADDHVLLPDFSFIVQVGQAKAGYHGVDPRSGVQFPGILKRGN